MFVRVRRRSPCSKHTGTAAQKPFGPFGLARRCCSSGWDQVERQRLKDDLEMSQEMTVENSGKTFNIRSELTGKTGKAMQATGVALRPPIRILTDEDT